MEGNQSSGVSNAGATRKRRSSILKSHRPPRTPFSELEFNVATPTDATKSRRVSFSRKTGVAEFATNEATTTWKNFYEEQNRSLESSGHDADRPPRPSVLGNRIFDQQFQEIEAEIDFAYPGQNSIGLGTSFNNVLVTHQTLDSEDRVTAPSNKFEMSAFTESNSKVISDLSNRTLGCDSGRIDINFSNLNSISDKDDLDDIVRDLEISRPNVVGPVAFSGEVSQYIEFDLNGTQGPLRDNESDMSITDTIHSPKKEVSRISTTDRDWANDKENIVVNPYVTPAETDNFAINDETSQVLVFDGRKLTYADINADLDELVEDVRESSVNKKAQPERQTAFGRQDIEESVHVDVKSDQTIMFHEDEIADMSVTQAVPNHVLKASKTNIPTQKRQTNFSNDDDNADVSITQAIPNNILSRSINPQTKRQTIVFDSDEADISMTQCIPNAVLSKTVFDASENIEQNSKASIQPKRQTIVYANDDAEISMTRAIPTNIMSRKSLKLEISDTTEVKQKRQTIVFANDDIDADISMTQAIPANILSTTAVKQENSEPVQKRQTIVFDNDAEISMTQPIPSSILSRASLKSETTTSQPKRHTVVFANDDIDADISMTKAIPSNILSRNSLNPDRSESLPTQPKRQTVVFANDDMDADISMTQAIPTNILNRMSLKSETVETTGIQPKRQTIVFANDDMDADISMTQSIPSNILSRKSLKPETVETTGIQPKRQTIIVANDDMDADISMTQSIPSNILSRKSLKPETVETTAIQPKRQTIIFANDDMDADISMTQSIPSNILSRKSLKPEISDTSTINPKRQTVVFVNDDLHIPVTQAVSFNLLKQSSILDDQTHPVEMPKPEHAFDNMKQETHRKSLKTEIITDKVQPKKETVIFDNAEADNDMNQIIPKDSIKNEYIKEPLTEMPLESVSFTLHPTEDQATKPKGKSNIIRRDRTSINNRQSFKPETLVYTLTTTMDTRDNTDMAIPSSKGDDFHASSQQIDLDNQVGLNNPQTTSHSHKAPKVSTKKPAEQVESKFEEAINSISYENMAVSSTKIVSENSDVSSSEETKEVKLESKSESQSQGSEGSSKSEVKSRKFVLNELLDMSYASMPDGFDDKDVMADPSETAQVAEPVKDTPINDLDTDKDEDESEEGEFVDAKDSNEAKDSIKEKSSNNSMFLIMRDSDVNFLPHVEERDRTTDTKDLVTQNSDRNLNLEHRLDELLQRDEDRKSLATDSSTYLLVKDANKSKMQLDVSRKTFRDADDTRELLEILSSMTDKTITEKSPRKSIAASKSEQTKRLTFALDGESLTSKDTLSVALSLDNESEEYVPETPAQPPKKSIRLSHDVVKTLQYEDETVRTTALKKTAFGETSYMSDKAKVIPSYMNASDGIKELMDDLVKPMADVTVPLPSGIDKGMNEHPSTCSTQIQANLISSSQIDFELCSSSSNNEVMKNLASNVAYEGNNSVSRALKDALYTSPVSEKTSFVEKRATQPDQIIVFDQNNPLNNVLLVPTDYAHAHKYNPNPVQEYKQEFDVERVSVKLDQEREPLPNIQEEICSMKSEHSVVVTEVVDSEVNTVIAMKGNKELLEDISSLTLVEGTSDTEMDVDEPKASSPIKVIYQLDEIILDDEYTRKRTYSPAKAKDFEVLEVTPKPLSKVQRLSNSPTSVGFARKSPERSRAAQERSPEGRKSPTRKLEIRRSPTKKSNNSSPTRKSPDRQSPLKQSPDRLSPTFKSDRHSPTRKSPESRRKSAELYKKPNTIVTVQRMEAEYGREDNVSGDVTSPSSRAATDTASVISSESRSPSTVRSKSSWKQDSSRGSRLALGDAETSANVITRIDMLPCMGTKLCEWDASGVDQLSFRLLHARVRVSFRLGHRHDNAARSHVRADTGVLGGSARAHVSDMYPTEIKKVIATLSVNYAADAMRYLLLGVTRAGDIPNVLRRCAAVAEAAQRWAKCMHEAYCQLAFTLAMDGRLTLKVCNLSLRSVWEVTMQLSLAAPSGGRAPHPAAGALRARAVVGEPPGELAGAAGGGEDWGHAPRTIWKIFRHLKNKRADDALSLV